jgi:serine/threonine protein phosphatase PrpC
MSETMMFKDYRTTLNYEVSLANNLGKRDEQQDTIYLAVSDREVLAVLSDGMGALKNGRLASLTAVHSFIENCEINSNDNWMADALAMSDEIVSQMNLGKDVPEAGATLVAIYIIDNYIQWVGAGDSRLYLFRSNELLQITNDHNYFYELKDKVSTGKISQEEYESQMPYGDQLVSFVGMGGLQLIDQSVSPFLLQKNDLILICSDGVYKTIDKSEIVSIIENNNTAEEIGNTIISVIETANKRFQDNYSFALVRIIN